MDPDGINDYEPAELKRSTWSELTRNGPLIVQRSELTERQLAARNAREAEQDEKQTEKTTDSIDEPSSELYEKIAKLEEERHWVSIPGAPAVDSPTVWHYTDANGLLGILNSSSLWATSINYLNDVSEYHYGLSILEEIFSLIQGSRKIHPLQKLFLLSCMQVMRGSGLALHTFSVSASVAGDSLSQWRAYSGSNGYAIGLDATAEATMLCRDAGDLGYASGSVSQSWHSVIYDADEQYKLTEKAAAYVLNDAPHPDLASDIPYGEAVERSAAYLVSILCYLKNPSFSEEQEVRALFTTVDGVDNKAISYRATEYGIAPYVHVVFPLQPGRLLDSWRSTVKGVLPSTTIRVGPGPHRNSAAAGIKDYLESLRITAVVEISEAPLR